jgi:hypothetical protein
VLGPSCHSKASLKKIISEMSHAQFTLLRPVATRTPKSPFFFELGVCKECAGALCKSNVPPYALKLCMWNEEEKSKEKCEVIEDERRNRLMRIEFGQKDRKDVPALLLPARAHVGHSLDLAPELPAQVRVAISPRSLPFTPLGRVPSR